MLKLSLLGMDAASIAQAQTKIAEELVRRQTTPTPVDSSDEHAPDFDVGPDSGYYEKI